MNRCVRQAGFTLLELMIGLALLGLILLLLFSALRMGSRAWDSGEKVLTESNTRVVVSAYLRRALAQVQPWRFTGDTGQVLAFMGDDHKLRYAGLLPSQSGRAGLRLIALEIEDGRLLLRHRSPGADTRGFDVLDGADKIVLLEGVRSMALSYFGAEQSDAEATWRNTWHSETALPKLVRVTLVDSAGNVWPELVAAPMLDADANCDWDPVRKYCQDPTITARIVAGPQASRAAR